MKIETPVIAIILGSLVFTGIFGIFFSVANNYDVDYNLTVYESQNGTSLQNAFDRINETKNDMDSIINDFEETELRDTGSLYAFLSLSLKIGKQVFNSLNIFKDIMYITAEIFGIDANIPAVFVSIVLIIFIISIIMVLLGRTYAD